jgi:hypothetical protein
MKWKRPTLHMRETGKSYTILIGKLERKKPLGESRNKWENNIKMDLTINMVCLWIHEAQDRIQ